MSATTDQLREAARDRRSGEFGEHAHTEPDIELQADEWVGQPSVYEMPLSRKPEAVKRVERANRRLERAGIAERFEMTFEDFVHVDEGETVGVQAVRLTLNTPRLGMAGWSFVGAHEMTADGHIVNYGPARVTEMRCDHCGHARMRGKVYTVVNEDGEEKVVGSNCLAAFLGVKPEGLWTLTFALSDEGGEDDDEASRFASSTGDVTVAALDLIGAALAASEDGERFIPKSKATTTDPATAERVSGNLRALVAAGEAPERREHAAQILHWVNEQKDGESDYIDSLRAVLAGKERWVARKHFGIGVSAVSAHRNAQAWAARDALRATEAASLYNPGHVGTVGVRMRDEPMTVVEVSVSHTGEYGPSTRLVLRDDATGRQVIWWASGDRSAHHVGDKVTVTATVKSHDNFRGTDQTTVQRASISAQ